MPYIEEEIWQKHSDDDNFILIGLAKDTPKRPQTNKEIEFMTNKTGVTYPIIRDINSNAFNLFAEKKSRCDKKYHNRSKWKNSIFNTSF